MFDNQLTFPNAPRSTWIADVCHVCQRREVRPATREIPGALACDECVSIDRALGAPFEAQLLTPLDPGFADGRAVLHNRLWGAPGASLDAALRTHHVKEIARLKDQARAVGIEGIHARYPGGPPWAASLAWDQWTWTFPATFAASLAGYRRYAAAVHPWIDSVEPRVSDLGWLESAVLGQR